MVRRALTSGAGVEKLQQIIANQGGDPRVVDDYSRLPSAPDQHRVTAPRAGYLAEIQAEAVGRAAVALGAGRARLEDAIDPGVGIDILLEPGAVVKPGDAVLLVHHRGGRGLDEALPLLAGGIVVTDGPPAVGPLILERILND
jgi:thymidine phosphorylase